MAQSLEVVSVIVRLILLLTLISLLSACAAGPGRAPVPVEERSGVNKGREAPDMPATMRSPSIPFDQGIQSASPSAAVIALLGAADRERASGRTDSAAASLERALRLEPKNAYLWYRLAALRLEQQNWQQAFVLAYKSNSLVSDNTPLKIRNWKLIAEAKRRLGDAAAAREAEAEINRLRVRSEE
jgi:tetratricopeptide (TPR) repeat protein